MGLDLSIKPYLIEFLLSDLSGHCLAKSHLHSLSLCELTHLIQGEKLYLQGVCQK